MSARLIKSVALTAVLCAGAAVSAPVLADPAPPIPSHLFQLPERQWVVSPCAAERCEAGYRSGDLVLSVRRAPEAIIAVAGVRGCDAVSARGLRRNALETLSPADQYSAIQRTTLAAAQTARTQCGQTTADLIDTTALVRIVPGQ